MRPWAKEAARKATDNEPLEADGQADQDAGQAKKGGENVENAGKDVTEAFRS